jgi:hypothetical protein
VKRFDFSAAQINIAMPAQLVAAPIGNFMLWCWDLG